MKIQNIVKITLVAALVGLVLACAPTSNSTPSVSQNDVNVPSTEQPSSVPADSSSDSRINRSKTEIQEVIKLDTYNRFRVIYNQFLKKRPGFGGKIVLQFKIMSDGTVEEVSVLSSTTGYEEFDAAIAEDMGQWTFASGNYKDAKVTIPFTFYE